VVGLICDNTLFVKPTPASELELKDREKAPPYPGAKDYFVITEDDLEEKKFLINVLFKVAENVVVKGKKVN
jgi:TfoX/Sxy family transcriptional regulator of competence genes